MKELYIEYGCKNYRKAVYFFLVGIYSNKL